MAFSIPWVQVMVIVLYLLSVYTIKSREIVELGKNEKAKSGFSNHYAEFHGLVRGDPQIAISSFFDFYLHCDLPYDKIFYYHFIKNVEDNV